MIDGQTWRLLQDLPNDLRARGWSASHESSTLKTFTGTEYKAVYARRLDQGVDDERINSVVYRGDRSFVTVSARSASWDDARGDAIAEMRAVDARRADAG